MAELDPDERARIQAMLDQAGEGMKEEEVQDAVAEFFEAATKFAVVLHNHLPLQSVPGGLGGAFQAWFFNDYPDVYCTFDPDYIEDDEEEDDAWEPYPEPANEHKREGSGSWCPRCGAQFGPLTEWCPYDGHELKRYDEPVD